MSAATQGKSTECASGHWGQCYDKDCTCVCHRQPSRIPANLRARTAYARLASTVVPPKGGAK